MAGLTWRFALRVKPLSSSSAMKKTKALVAGFALLFGFGGLAVYILIDSRRSFERAREANSKLISERILFDREQSQKRAAFERSMAENKAKMKQESERTYQQSIASQNASRPVLDGLSSSSSAQQLRPLTTEEIAECDSLLESRARLLTRDGGGFKFEGDRDKAVANKDYLIKHLGCLATPQRMQQINQAEARRLQRAIDESTRYLNSFR